MKEKVTASAMPAAASARRSFAARAAARVSAGAGSTVGAGKSATGMCSKP